MTRLKFLAMNSLMIGIIFAVTVFARSTNAAAVMSVDLGNEWIKVGVVSPGVPMEIALNKESKRKTSAVIGFRDGVRSFGEEAETLAIRFPSNAYKYLLDLLGKTVDNPLVELYKKRFPYYEIVGDENRNTVVFKNGDELYSVEELVAQLLTKAKEFAEDSTAQPVTECVLIVPGFFGQAERAALLTSAQLANLKVLQLINDYTAVALNYGVFRRTEFNETAQYFLFYDMGAHKTSAAVVSYQLVKDKATREINPVIQILGVGYDRTLGGLEIQLRLRDFLAKEFNKLGKTKTDVTKNSRAMAKLFKEAGRLKNVLSANADHYAQVENLIEDHDFKLQITREKLEQLCEDLWPRVVVPLQQALKMSGLSLDILTQVILFGGGTRVPKIQEILKEAIKQELGKNLNADEGAAMGAVYKAADLATGFKVKKFVIKDAVIFPIQVIFQRDSSGESVKTVKRTLFGQMNAYPQKKVVTFNKHTRDFDFYVNYAELNHLAEHEIKYIGNLNLSHVELTKIVDILEKYTNEGTENKGIKAHFALDYSGLFGLTGVDFVFEKQQAGPSGEDDESTLSKLGSTISKLFSGSDNDKVEEKKTAEGEATEKAENLTENSNQTNQTLNLNATDEAKQEENQKNETVRIVVLKEPVENKETLLYATPLSGENYDRAHKRLMELDQQDKSRKRREHALNAVESFVIEAQHRLSDAEYAECATEEESKKIIDECNSISEWLYEDGSDADAETYEKRLEQLKAVTTPVYARHWEHGERGDALKALDGMIDGAQKFLASAKNLTKETNPEKDVFTDVEINVLENTINETIQWKKTEVKAQNKLKKNEPVRLTVKDITDKMALLDREVKYLVNKIKIWKPKKPKKEKKEKPAPDDNATLNEENADEEEVKIDGNEDEEPVIDRTEEAETTTPPVETSTPTTAENEKDETQTPHGEL